MQNSIRFVSMALLTCAHITAIWSHAQTSTSATATRDGLILTVSRLSSPTTPGDIEIVARLENTSSEPLQWAATGPTMGFAFTLTDRNGQSIPSKWKQWNNPNRERNVFRHIPTTLPVGQALTYQFGFGEAFGDHARERGSLRVTWDPGSDANGNDFTRGEGIEAMIVMADAQTRNIVENDSPSQSELHAPHQKRAINPLKGDESHRLVLPRRNGHSDEATTSQPASTNLAWIVIVLASLGVLLLMLKNRR